MNERIYMEMVQGPANEHIILVALQVQADTREQAHVEAQHFLGEVDGQVVAWWTAEDDRLENSDSDSAVFCRKGKQDAASDLLVGRDLA